VEQIDFGLSDKSTKLDQFTKDELISRFTSLEDEYHRAIKEIYRLKYKDLTEAQLNIVLQEHLAELNGAMYGASSERYKKRPVEKTKKKLPDLRIKRPSERYPNVNIRNILIESTPEPSCDACGKRMLASGMTEDSEQLTVTPKKYEILKYQRTIYRCTCHGCMKTADQLPRMIEGSTYSDEMIMDVTLSKYCDLIPIERYVQMAKRSGLPNLPSNSLYDLTHKFAFFVKQIYVELKNEVLRSRVLHADETPHKMLEGSAKKTWYLWGFSTKSVCYLECHDTRSGDVASEILLNSKCEVLVSDVYSGYGKAIRLANVERQRSGKNQIANANCNAHARRYFFKLRDKLPESHFYLDHYHEIYSLEARLKNAADQGDPPSELLTWREQMRCHFEAMRENALNELPRYFKGSKYEKALSYFVENYPGLTHCLGDADVALDNNLQERLLRPHVVGRKTWYGTHSEEGAETAAILFSLVETCKLNGVNPREYFPDLVEMILHRQKPVTPARWKALRN
jgi:transposase